MKKKKCKQNTILFLKSTNTHTNPCKNKYHLLAAAVLPQRHEKCKSSTGFSFSTLLGENIMLDANFFNKS